jgi:addiction module RelE/StbE family toxin
MDGYRFEVAQKAKQDLRDIYRYIGRILKNPKAAFELNKKFKEAFLRTTQFPKSGFDCESEKGYKKIIVENYVVFYKADDELKIVTFYRVWYGYMDYEKYI